MWYEVWPPIIASWGAALAALYFILRQVWRATKWGRRATTAIIRLAEIGDAESWPNGSSTLPEAISNIYERQTETNQLIVKTADRLDAYVVAHRADHGLTD